MAIQFQFFHELFEGFKLGQKKEKAPLRNCFKNIYRQIQISFDLVLDNENKMIVYLMDVNSFKKVYDPK